MLFNSSKYLETSGINVRQYGIDITQANLQQWALANGLNANMQAMTQAEKAALRYKYVMSQLSYVTGDFSDTAETWHNQLVLLKQSFIQLGAVIGGTFINALKPFVGALNAVMKYVISFATTVSDALGHIFGWKIEVTKGYGGIADALSDIAEDANGASDGVGDLADQANDASKGLGDAANKAKKLKATILGFDELNVLNAPDEGTSGKSGSSGNGSGSGAGSGAGVGTGISSQLTRSKTIFEDIQSNIDSLKELGKYISDALSTSMENIDWNKIYKKAENFGTGLADFLNGLISPRLFYDTGMTIANSINTAFHAINAFNIQFDWVNLGKSFASGMNGFFTNVDFNLIADGLISGVNGAFDSLTGFATTFKWKEAADGIRDGIYRALTGIKWKEGASSIKQIILDLADALADISTPENFEAFANAVGEVLGEFDLEFWVHLFEDACDIISDALIGTLKAAIKNPVQAFKVVTALTGLFALVRVHHTLTNGISILASMIGSKLAEQIGLKVGAGSAVETTLRKSITDILRGASGIDAPQDVLGKTFGRFTDALVSFGGSAAITGWLTKLFDDQKKLKESTSNFEKLTSIFKQLGAETNMSKQEMTNLSYALGSVDERVTSSTQIAKGLVEQFENAGFTTEQMASAFKMMNEQGIISDDVYEKLSWKMDQLSASTDGVTRTLNTKTVGAFEALNTTSHTASTGVESVWDKFKNMTNGFSLFGAAKMLLMKLAIKGLGETGADKKIGDVDDALSNIKGTAIGKVLDGIRDKFIEAGNSSTTFTDNAADGISQGNIKIDKQLGLTTNLFDGVVKSICSSGTDAGKSFANNLANALQGTHIPVPHLAIKSFTNNRIGKTTYSTPNYGINWYAKGGLFSSADIIGVGERGKEAVLPLEDRRAMNNIADSITKNMGSGVLEEAMTKAIVNGNLAFSGGNDGSPYVMNITLKTMDNEVLARAVERGNLARNMRYGR